MAFNPPEQRGVSLDQQLRSQRELNVKPIVPDHCDPYTRCRIITMHGIYDQVAVDLTARVARMEPDPYRTQA